jgi:methyl halide transferase
MITSIEDPSFWDKRYLENSANWDLKTPTPVFTSLIDKKFILPASLLVPGCGKGYDAVYAAEKGFSVTAVDFSKQALQFAENMAQEKKLNIEFVNEDIFNLPISSKYDYIFEYTTYCAINPARRREYGEKMASYLKPGGKLIALLFPIDGRAGGPPFNIDPVAAYKDFTAYLELEFYSRIIESVKPRKGKEVLHIYKKTY